MDEIEVFKEIAAVRDLYLTTTTDAQWEAMIKGLGYILLNEELSELATALLTAAIDETSLRFRWLKEQRHKRG